MKFVVLLIALFVSLISGKVHNVKRVSFKLKELNELNQSQDELKDKLPINQLPPDWEYEVLNFLTFGFYWNPSNYQDEITQVTRTALKGYNKDLKTLAVSYDKSHPGKQGMFNAKEKRQISTQLTRLWKNRVELTAKEEILMSIVGMVIAVPAAILIYGFIKFYCLLHGKTHWNEGEGCY